MTAKKYVVKIWVYTDELLLYYTNNPNYGTKEQPLPAESFYELVSPYALFTERLKNILLFENDCIYTWVIENADGVTLDFYGDDSVMDLEMITNTPSDAKWKKVFKDAPQMDDKGKLKIKSKGSNKSEFELETSNDVDGGGVVKYSFVFEFKDSKGGIKYGIVDPMGVTVPPPPPPPKP